MRWLQSGCEVVRTWLLRGGCFEVDVYPYVVEPYEGVNPVWASAQPTIFGATALKWLGWRES